MTGYSDTLRKYAADNSHVGRLDNPDGMGEVGLAGREAGQRLAVRFTLNVAGRRIKDIRFQVFGCGFTVAACAAAAELVREQTLEDVQSLTAEAINQKLGGLPEERSYCAELACQAVQAAVSCAADGHGLERVNSAVVLEDNNEHETRISPDDDLYKALMATPAPPAIEYQDRMLFACLLTVASREPYPLAVGLGVDEATCEKIIETCFPGFDRSLCERGRSEDPLTDLDINQDVLALLLSHVPEDGSSDRRRMARWLAQIIAARAAQPGHLWVSMGLFERSKLTAAIRRHLPTLAQANNQGMRWKRYLFKQVCDANGGTLCKSPNCKDCSDYDLCFAQQQD